MPIDLLKSAARRVRPKRASFYPEAMAPAAPQTTGGTPPPGAPPPPPGSHVTEDPWTGRGARDPGAYGGSNAGAARGWMGKVGGGFLGGVQTNAPQGAQTAPGWTAPQTGYGQPQAGAAVPTPGAGDVTEGAGAGDLSNVTDWLNSLINGNGESFDPIRDALRAQEDAARRRMAEAYASRGMAMSGALAGGLGDITQDFARQEAEKYMQWRQQQVQNKFGAAQLLFQNEWKNLDFEHQKALAELMFELDRKAKYGENYNPELGDFEIQILRDLMMSDSLDDSGKRIIRQMLNQLGYGGLMY